MSTTDLGNKKIFSNNLQTFIDRQNLTVPQLAEKLGIKYTTFRDWVKGNTYPRIDKIELLADYFGVKKSALVEHHDNGVPLPIHSYPYIPAAISAGTPATVDAITPDQLEQVAIPDAVMGKWAGHSDISLMRANGDSMNRVIPNGSLIGVRKVDEISDLKNGDIVVFDCDGEYAVKRFFNDKQNRTYIFQPDSDRDGFFPVTHSYDDEDLVAIVGKVVMYVVELS
ncbi:helix-turn-helix transcriptional regulator [Lacticaseibacillus suilingensis]|uniref:Helix-turn-helix transcriptional regulator n=1 Tax=Lacticaseibacillus suilingensis TaxID=2799577 RepID=A0ABW4BDY1_9LACO|nr:XRE family transcriptional regulator [Lacticaseibacillus suilingensis]